MESVIHGGIGFILGTIIALLIPFALQKIIDFKCEQAKKDRIELNLCTLQRILLIVLHALMYGLAAIYIPFPIVLLVAIFVTVSFIATIIDFYMRIIPNELVLFLLGTGLIYRLIDGGFRSLLGSLAAIGITIVIFGLSAAVTYLRKQTIGVGAGDIKLALVISIALGFPGIIYFYMAFAVAVLAYILLSTRLRLSYSMQSYLPMAAPIMIAFLAALFWLPLSQFLGFS